MDRQEQVVTLCAETFGIENVKNKQERLLRFLEEAGELVQCGGMTREQAHVVIDYVYNRPVETEIWKELGGVMLTAYGVADAHGHDLEDCCANEMIRLRGRMKIAKAKHDAKPQSVRA